jgi:VWFA-related protein
MRVMAASFAALTLLAPAPLVAQTDQQPPVFRSGVEVLEVDVTVVDGRGNPITDLRSPEFQVSVDGQARRVVSAEYIADAPVRGARPPRVDPYISNNTDRRPGRLIMLAVDRNNTDTNTLRGALGSITNFVKGLSPEDRLALVTVPPPGPTIDFTTNHKLVLDSLSRIVGADDPIPSRFNISDYEALVMDDKSNVIVIQRLLYRTCGDTDPITLSNCDRDVEQEAMTIAQNIRRQTAESVSAFAVLLKNLADVQGNKSLIILSQGLMLEGAASEATALARLAAEARVNVNVLLFDTPRGLASTGRVSETSSEDRDLREHGLETLASRSRGSLFRVIANPAYIFDRLTSEIAGHYMLGVEPIEKDRDGKTHQIKVEVRRQGVSIRARQQFQYVVREPGAWSRDVLMEKVLRSPTANTELPMRMTTYVYRDAAPNKVKLVMAAEVDPAAGDGALDVAMGFALYNDSGRLVASGQERKIYSKNTDLPLVYDLTMAIEPGNYRLRLAAIDLTGNSGSVEREVQAFNMSNQEIALGDLLLTPARSLKNGDIRPGVIPKALDGQIATYTELYSNKPGGLADTKVVFEVADSADGPTLRSDIAEVRERPDGTYRQAMAIVPVTALPPGQYVARAIVSSNGKTVGKLTRPFQVLPGNRVAASSSATAAGGASAAPTSVPPAAPPGITLGAKPPAFNRADVLKPETLKAVFDAMEKTHASAKSALAKARGGQFEGTAMMALDAGDQAAAALLRGLEYLSKGQLDPAATQFGVALRNSADSPLASFYLGACFAAAGKDREALAAWQRALAAKLPLPELPLLVADGWLRMGQPSQAVDPLKQALEMQPQNDALRKNLGIAQSQMGQHDQAYLTIRPPRRKTRPRPANTRKPMWLRRARCRRSSKNGPNFSRTDAPAAALRPRSLRVRSAVCGEPCARAGRRPARLPLGRRPSRSRRQHRRWRRAADRRSARARLHRDGRRSA